MIQQGRPGDDAEEAFVRLICLYAIECARGDGAPISAEDERRVREYFAEQRRLRAK